MWSPCDDMIKLQVSYLVTHRKHSEFYGWKQHRNNDIAYCGYHLIVMKSLFSQQPTNPVATNLSLAIDYWEKYHMILLQQSWFFITN